jgi:hypothetical protein
MRACRSLWTARMAAWTVQRCDITFLSGVRPGG